MVNKYHGIKPFPKARTKFHRKHGVDGYHFHRVGHRMNIGPIDTGKYMRSCMLNTVVAITAGSHRIIVDQVALLIVFFGDLVAGLLGKTQKAHTQQKTEKNPRKTHGFQNF